MPGSTSESSSRSPHSIDELSVLNVSQLASGDLQKLADRYGVKVQYVAALAPIEGSYWGDREAGLKGNELFVRPDTPVHSALHELCHYVCMPPSMRSKLDTNAGGDYDEENGVCFLQIILSSSLKSFSRARMLQDMDAWGYTFRLGSARAWFEGDAEDARDWLLHFGLINTELQATFNLRVDES